MSARHTITGGDRFTMPYRPSRRDPRERIQPMTRPASFISRHSTLIGWTIAAASAVLFCGGYV